MNTFRLYTGSDGQAQSSRSTSRKKPDWIKGLATTQISFRESPVGRFLDWHPAPAPAVRHHPVGQLEIGLGDGSKHVFGPGDARWSRTPRARVTRPA